MKMSFRWYGFSDPVTLEKIRQIPNMRSIVTAVYDVPVGEVWPEERIAELKNAVEAALRTKFPYQVHRGNKSIKVNGNTYRKQADAVPCLSMHYYYKIQLNDYLTHHEGVVVFADDGLIIRNFPKQHIANGKAKNNRTKRYYKKMVRIMKKMRCLMSDRGYTCAEKVSSFGLESLLWNFPDNCFTSHLFYGLIFKEIVDYAYHHKWELSNYFEANGIKKLCSTREEVSNYSTFIDELHTFFEYDYSL